MAAGLLRAGAGVLRALGQPDRTLELPALTRACPACGGPLWAAYKTQRAVSTLEGTIRLRLQVRRCRDPLCPRHHVPLRPEQEGRYALPQHEFGLDVIALIGTLRHAQHRSIPEIHSELARRGVTACLRTVTNLLDRYDELLARPLIERDITLACVSNEVGGPYVGNARWVGAPLAALLDEAGVDPAATQLVSTSADGFTCGTPVAAVTDGRDAMLAISMNGEPLPI